jgi:hypothetical protein
MVTMRSSPIVRTLLTLAGIVLIIAPVLYAADHPLTARLTLAFIACWLLAAALFLAGYPRRTIDDCPSPPREFDNG